MREVSHSLIFRNAFEKCKEEEFSKKYPNWYDRPFILNIADYSIFLIQRYGVEVEFIFSKKDTFTVVDDEKFLEFCLKYC